MLDDFKQYLKGRGLTTEDVAEKTGYSKRYITNLLNGSDPLNDRARFRLMRAFPGIGSILLSEDGNDNEETNNAT